jgi:hypothetical protein
VSERIGCRLERASIDTRDALGTIVYFVTRSHLPHLQVSGQVGHGPDDQYGQAGEGEGHDETADHDVASSGIGSATGSGVPAIDVSNSWMASMA